mgnify:CR=1 FL=1
MWEFIKNFDSRAIIFFQKYNVLIARLAIFTVYFWFGLLKILGFSPATPLVKTLFDATLSFFIPFTLFYLLFSLFEIIIGIIFLIKGLERLGIVMIFAHLFTTVLPLVLTPDSVWQSFLVPTLEGQYIIKNILIFASITIIGSKLTPLSEKR